MAKKKNVDQVISEYMKAIGSKGGKNAPHALTKKKASEMAKKRWAKEKKKNP